MPKDLTHARQLIIDFLDKDHDLIGEMTDEIRNLAATELELSKGYLLDQLKAIDPKEDEALQKAIRRFFILRWSIVMHSNIDYTNMPHSPMNQFCMELASLIRDKDEDGEDELLAHLLMPTLEDYMYHVEQLQQLTEKDGRLTPWRFIVSEDGKGVMPIEEFFRHHAQTRSKPDQHYYAVSDRFPALSPQEKQWLGQSVTPYAEQFLEQFDELSKISFAKNSLGEAVLDLTQALGRAGLAMRGENDEADFAVYQHIERFINKLSAFEKASPGTKEKLFKLEHPNKTETFGSYYKNLTENKVGGLKTCVELNKAGIESVIRNELNKKSSGEIHSSILDTVIESPDNEEQEGDENNASMLFAYLGLVSGGLGDREQAINAYLHDKSARNFEKAQKTLYKFENDIHLNERITACKQHLDNNLIIDGNASDEQLEFLYRLLQTSKSIQKFAEISKLDINTAKDVATRAFRNKPKQMGFLLEEPDFPILEDTYFFAVKQHATDLLDALAKSSKPKPDINATDSDGSTALQIAAMKGYRGCVGKLLDARANTDSGTPRPLEAALNKNHAEIAVDLVNHGAAVCATDINTASRGSMAEVLKTIFEKHKGKLQLNESKFAGEVFDIVALLKSLASNNNVELLGFLLENGLLLNKIDPDGQILNAALEAGHDDFALKVLKHYTTANNEAAKLAATKGCPNSLARILNSNSAAATRDLLQGAIKSRNDKTAVLLLQHEAQHTYDDFIDAISLYRDEDGYRKTQNPLTETMRFLLKNTNYVKVTTSTPPALHHAVLHSTVEAVDLLLENEVEVNSQGYGATALDLAIYKIHYAHPWRIQQDRSDARAKIKSIALAGGKPSTKIPTCFGDYYISKPSLPLAVEELDADSLELVLKNSSDILDHKYCSVTALEGAIRSNKAGASLALLNAEFPNVETDYPCPILDLQDRLLTPTIISAQKRAKTTSFQLFSLFIQYVIDVRENEDIWRSIAKTLIRDHAWHLDIALNEAAKYNNIFMLELLLGNGANINSHPGDMPTPLQTAAIHGNVTAVRFLLEKNANISAPFYNKDGYKLHIFKYLTLLSLSSPKHEKPDIDKVCALFIQSGVSTDQIASGPEDKNCALYIQSSPNIDRITSGPQRGALQNLMAYELSEAAAAYLPKASQEERFFAFEDALKMGYDELASRIYASTAGLYVKRAYSLIQAARNRKALPKTFSLLIEPGYVDKEDIHGKSALVYVVENNDLNAISRLADKGACLQKKVAYSDAVGILRFAPAHMRNISILHYAVLHKCSYQTLRFLANKIDLKNESKENLNMFFDYILDKPQTDDNHPPDREKRVLPQLITRLLVAGAELSVERIRQLRRLDDTIFHPLFTNRSIPENRLLQLDSPNDIFALSGLKHAIHDHDTETFSNLLEIARPASSDFSYKIYAACVADRLGPDKQKAKDLKSALADDNMPKICWLLKQKQNRFFWSPPDSYTFFSTPNKATRIIDLQANLYTPTDDDINNYPAAHRRRP